MAGDIVYDVILGSNTVRQVLKSDYQPNLEDVVGMASGAVDPSEVMAGKAEPQATFETSDLAGFLAALSISAGAHVSAGTITIPWNKRAQGGSFAGAGANSRINGTHGLIVPTRISCGQDDEAAIAAAMVHFYSTDGFAAAATISNSQNLAATAFTGQYTLGPAKVNGTALGELLSIAVNPGITVEVKRHNGGNYPTLVHITQRRPTIDLTFEDISEIPAIGFAAMTSAAVWFRKRSSVGFVADATEQHVKFSFTDGLVIPQGISASGIQAGAVTLRLKGEALTASAAAAID